MDKKELIAIDFDDNLNLIGNRTMSMIGLKEDYDKLIKEQERRCEIVKKLIEQGYDVYILTASLQPLLEFKHNFNAIYYYEMTWEYEKLEIEIKEWLNENIMQYEWFITPIKQHNTTKYIDVACSSWEDLEQLLQNKIHS